MFQHFDPPRSGSNHAKRLHNLRAEMVKAGLDAFVVLRTDVHQGEYVASCDERLAWLTGFSGSAGFCVVTKEKAAVFSDGRYRVQLAQQIDQSFFSPVDWPQIKLADWLKDNLSSGMVGFDPELHTIRESMTLEKVLGKAGLAWTSSSNLIDRIWQDRPSPPNAPLRAQPLKFAGQGRDEKIQAIAAKITGDSVILTQPDSIAWLLNIRGSDIAHIPVALCFCILHKSGAVELFCDGDVADNFFGKTPVKIASKAAFWERLEQLQDVVEVDDKIAPYRVKTALKQADICFGMDPCLLPKACKNKVECAGARAAHLRDGVAVTEFLSWLDQQKDITEICAVKKLEAFRSATGSLVDISFDTISALGPDGAIVHYRVNEQSNRRAQENDLFLIDSGGQYVDGTTDITRTVILGNPSSEHRYFFTLVLKGLIAVSQARFPAKTSGREIDPLARQFLRAAGYDYDHGTGHGVGAYLSVHEGPVHISKTGDIALEAGMILSNEPGFYKDGDFGIRIENLLLVRRCQLSSLKGNWLEFETLTLVPIDRRLIDGSLLSMAECAWLDDYHARVRQALTPYLDDKNKAWLLDATKPLGDG